jgi:DNA segregation ATPase FtsK/SpoIIIE-like protein
MPARAKAAPSRSTRSSRAAAPAPRRRRSGRNWTINGEIVRIILGTVMLILGVMLLIGLFVPSGGQLTDFIRNIVAPWFGTMRWLLPFLLLLLGYYLYRAQSDNSDWELTLVGSAVSYLSLLGVVGLLTAHDAKPRGGGVGTALANFLTPLISAPGAGLILTILTVAGLLLALDMSLPAVMAPMGRLVERAINALFRPAPESIGDGAGATAVGAAGVASPSAVAGGLISRAEKRGKEAAPPASDPKTRFADAVSAIPVAISNPGPLSQTFAPPVSAGSASRDGGPLSGGMSPRGASDAIAREGQSIRDGAPLRGQRSPSDVPAQSKLNGVVAIAEKTPRVYNLPPLALLEDIPPPRASDSTMDHQRNAAIISAKLASFNIPARVANWSAGPVVTQYEVEPSPEIKVSRIEALSDDLAMALAARTIRIEAPIPGKSVVGIEIPNKDFNIVALRRILEEVDLRAASKLTFALGRDVAGHARAADLAKMPHMLIAGATGSGKSVMVNALITSLLCNATPDEVRMILMDLKRVELSAYNGLPHLMIPVITEPERAKAALKWAVNEMENRYRRFAGANARNLAGYNETRADPADRMSYLVIIIDELADLMMREGKNVEEPIVRLAQKARATGIHMVLATQRPSVNVVTGLIKANFPSRIAFAMASQIDSRTILDMPGAEDLIGRGDMLFQPADLPRPIRLQGVYVSDKEIANICEHWRAEAEPHYDMGIIDTGEEPDSTEPAADEEADRLLLDAVGVIQEYDRASASLLQRRLKIGYARAARIMDQLESRGYIGPFDGSNARQVLRRDAGTPSPKDGYGEVDE